MRKTIACLLVLALSFIGCSTVVNVGGVGGFHSPKQGNGTGFGLKIRGGSDVDREVVSVDRVANVLEQTHPEDIVQDEMPIPEALAIGLIISFIVRAIIDSVQISIGNSI